MSMKPESDPRTPCENACVWGAPLWSWHRRGRQEGVCELISELQASEKSCSKEMGGIPEDNTGGLHMQEYF